MSSLSDPGALLGMVIVIAAALFAVSWLSLNTGKYWQRWREKRAANWPTVEATIQGGFVLPTTVVTNTTT